MSDPYCFNQEAFARSYRKHAQQNERLYPSRLKIVESNKIMPGELLMVDYQGILDEMFKGKSLIEAIPGHTFKIKGLDEALAEEKR